MEHPIYLRKRALRTHARNSLCVNSLQSPFAALSDHRRWFRIDVPAREHREQHCDMFKGPRLFLQHSGSHVVLCNSDPKDFSALDIIERLLAFPLFRQIFEYSEYLHYTQIIYLKIYLEIFTKQYILKPLLDFKCTGFRPNM